jgi:hypothetical protein
LGTACVAIILQWPLAHQFPVTWAMTVVFAVNSLVPRFKPHLDFQIVLQTALLLAWADEFSQNG